LTFPREIPLRDVFKMLSACADGHERRTTKHHYIVSWRGKTFRSLPLGSHQSRSRRPMIEVGHVRAMVAKLGIEVSCAERLLPKLAGSFRR
jgi:hypothetical protein